MSPASVYLGGLPETIGRKELFSHLSIYGTINALNLQKGYAFVEYDSEADATDLIATFADQPFMGHDVKVQSARQPRRHSVTSSNTSSSPDMERSRPRLAPEHARIRYPVIVNNLNRHTCWQELKDFGRLAGGTVAFCDIDKTNRRRGFLEYFTQEDADRAVKQLSGRELLGNVVTLSGYGRKTLRPENLPPSRSRSRSRSPPSTRHSIRDISSSRSPIRRHDRVTAPYPPPERIRENYERRPRDFGLDLNSISRRRQVRFLQHEKTDDSDPISAKHAHKRAHRAVDASYSYTDDLYYLSEERRAKMDQIAVGWMSLESNYPSLRLA
ncbi:hypothetical protein NM688_g7053 [Phlebia brevispora]|uniref:Uncharacterized protein n=1 Tax=Phlebia brevispora TaxID=194682 RepID=A0ACC1S9L2_9APHY|nr:hypothetical protein NM688_g7053 [Phlebia brevispora]